jgi:nucleoside 2-deoxyribosyltransferase
VWLPQEDGDLLVDMLAAGRSREAACKHVFKQDLEAIDSATLMVVVLDGRVIDEGATFELGYAWSRGKRCVALRTDPRQLLSHGNNPMIEQAIERTFTGVAALAQWVSQRATEWRKE